ncbi:tetratricopeptide repeat protein [Sandaracinus amylolyticus]|uniref:Putative regulatory protein (AfsR-like protein) n=1 Tax=Sandaracinus amylolyticus TaxID=927083 RepID=A0A0F6W3B1_9BACT|nr:tetratricopeptide repeat protein [Sandaracinus amylolyticus]AKF06412.1 putative regulatory protein (AfsR-like protein) [Sandaracinus amylolyticus]
MNLATQVCGHCGFENPRAFRACAGCGQALGAAPRPNGRGYLGGHGERTIVGVGGPSIDTRTTDVGDSTPPPVHVEESEPSLVGQHDASGAIRTGIETSFRRGVPTLVALEGGAGSGRTRLLFHAAELAARISPEVRVMYGLCREGDGPNAPISRMILERFGVTPSSSPSAVRGQMATIVAETLRSTDAITVSETAHLLGHVSGVPFPDSPFLMPLEDRPEELRRRAREAFARFVEGDAKQRPILVLLDNVHLAENDAWDLLQVMLSVDAPIAAVIAGEPPVGDRAAQLRAAGGVVSGPIAPLAESEIGSLLHVFLPTLRHAGEPVVAALAFRSRGNPGALRELVFALLEAGFFKRTDAGLVADVAQLEGGGLPVTIEDAIEARLARLDDLERATLDRAAVVGEVASDRAVLAQMRSERRPPGNRANPATLWPDDEDEVALATALLRLEEKGFLERLEETELAGGHEYRFVHSETRHFVYRAQPAELLARRHATVAHWITVTLELQRDGVAAMAAPHLEKAGMASRAGRAYLEAAKDELATMHTQSALRHVEKALELIPADEISRRIDALHVLGSLLTTLGRYDEATSAFAEMLEVSWRVGARGKGGAALNRIARVHRMRGEEEQARALLIRALELFRAAEDLRGVASTLDDLAQVERLRGDLEGALNAATEALAIRRGHGDARGEAVSLTTLGLIEHARGNLDLAEQSFRAALEIRESIGDRAGVMQSFNTLGIVAFERGDADRAEAAWRAALQEGRKMADRRTQTFVLNNLGEALGKAGRVDEAQASLEEARALAHELGDRRAMAEIERNLGLVALRRGDERAESILQRALAMAEEYGAKEAIALAHRAVGQLRAETIFDATGQIDRRAEESFLVAIDLFRDIGNEKDAARALSDLGQHLVERGDLDSAKERLREARAIMRRIGLAELERVERTLLELG